MRAGSLRARITFQKQAAIRDEYGEPEHTWSDVVTVWGSVKGLRSDEKLAALQIQGEATHEITIRYRMDITPDMRAVCGTRIFDITPPVDPDGRKCELRILCKEVI